MQGTRYRRWMMVARVTVLLLGMGGWMGKDVGAQTLPLKRDPLQGRAMVMTTHGVAAASQTLAAAAGARVLEEGGNAIDAAIAANAVMGLVEPESNGIGGDLFALVYIAKEDRLYALNASGWSPAAMTREALRSRGHVQMPESGIDSVTVPGAVAGWHALRERFGKLSFADILAPAIQYAETGFPVTELIAADWRNNQSKLSRQSHARKTYLPNGEPLKVGEIFRNPDLAASYRRIAQQGRDGFYKGATAEGMLALMREEDGLMRAEDLSAFQPEWVEPISTTYRGWTVYEVPPNTQGIAALMMLNILETFPMGSLGQNSAESLHLMIEAKKLAYADMLEQVGDPNGATIPVATLLSKQYGKVRAAQIDTAKANCRAVPADLAHIASLPGADTIYLTTADAEGNMVSLIQSIYLGFGSGFVAPGTGFVMHNRAGLFTMTEGKTNTVGPRKRPLHTIIPAFMRKGDVKITFGIMGGWNQAQAHAQFVSQIVDHGYNVQSALELPRFTKRSFDGCDVEIENRVPDAVLNRLRDRGHLIQVGDAFDSAVGNGQAILRDGKGVLYAGSDPRKDGAAVPANPPRR
ncbi:MAG: gamma-glutamyltransferase [Bryobacterales bacterium]|nr:gamma-glutamyltransferase [Bryobacterales bacterium]